MQALDSSNLSNALWDTTLLAPYWASFKAECPDHPVFKTENLNNSLPLSVWGDEGKALGESTMLFTWMLDISTRPGTSWASRFLFTLVPATRYHKVDGVNVTIEALLCYFVQRINSLSSSGVQLFFGAQQPVSQLSLYASLFCFFHSIPNSVLY